MRIETLGTAVAHPSTGVIHPNLEQPAPERPVLSDGDATRRAGELVRSMVTGLSRPDADRIDDSVLALSGIPARISEILEDSLGEGWVAVTLRQPDGRTVRFDETSYAGVWHVHQQETNGGLADRLLEIASVPNAVRAALLRLPATPGPGAALPDRGRSMLQDILRRAQKTRPESPVHVVNLTLAPLSAADLQALDQRLGTGPVSGVCLGFSTTRFASTGVQNVWRVRYFDQAERLILDTIEIVQVPEAIAAQRDEIRQSVARLDELATRLLQGTH